MPSLSVFGIIESIPQSYQRKSLALVYGWAGVDSSEDKGVWRDSMMKCDIEPLLWDRVGWNFGITMKFQIFPSQ